MKRAVLSAVFLAAVAGVGGCPIYSHADDGCWRDRDCENGYLCDDSRGDCYLPSSGSGRCARPSDCGVNETCTSAGRCVSGDCSFSDCVSGYRCDASTGIWQCISNEMSSGGGSGGASQVAGAAGAESSDSAGMGGDSTFLSGLAGAAGGG